MAGCRLRHPGGERRDSVKGAGGGMVRCYYSVDLVRGERNKLGKDRGGDGRRENGGRGERGANVFYFLGKVGNKVISSEAGRRWG